MDLFPTFFLPLSEHLVRNEEEDENENKINIYSSFVVIKHSSRKSCDLISNILKGELFSPLKQIHYVYCFSDASLNENAKKIFFSWLFWL